MHFYTQSYTRLHNFACFYKIKSETWMLSASKSPEKLHTKMSDGGQGSSDNYSDIMVIDFSDGQLNDFFPALQTQTIAVQSLNPNDLTIESVKVNNRAFQNKRFITRICADYNTEVLNTEIITKNTVQCDEDAIFLIQSDTVNVNDLTKQSYKLPQHPKFIDFGLNQSEPYYLRKNPPRLFITADTTYETEKDAAAGAVYAWDQSMYKKINPTETTEINGVKFTDTLLPA